MPGSALRKLRKRAGFSTQTELAEETGIEQYNISKYERGENRPSESALRTLADALDIEPDELRSLLFEEEEAEQGAHNHVTSGQQLDDWRDEVAAAEFANPNAKITAMSLSYFVDEVSWVAVVTDEAMAELSKRTVEDVRDGWSEVVESDYVERIVPEVKHAGRVDVRWVFRLTFPEE